MGQVRHIFLVIIFSFGISIAGFSQDKENPPQPGTKSHDGPPCDPGTGGGGTPPPPGLCLPIDDYVYLLMAVGVMYGCFKLRDFEISQPNS
ncbi:hypothetical protein MKO06_04935 [Gramella sp. GC03-9]|uniref:Uncharacterized protein n=1 Tax=Christiangramia oceanisediminis TaxID=2920386 RepID=A0A9X2I1I8_9FLAO|nr:hypothetical protein [Gramella oceanisediminis]MCP9199241.1 hypothetical protein [Gramella oceanisediminis]